MIYDGINLRFGVLPAGVKGPDNKNPVTAQRDWWISIWLFGFITVESGECYSQETTLDSARQDNSIHLSGSLEERLGRQIAEDDTTYSESSAVNNLAQFGED